MLAGIMGRVIFVAFSDETRNIDLPLPGHVVAEIQIELVFDNLVNLRITRCERIIGADGPGAISTILGGIFQRIVLKSIRICRICELIVKALCRTRKSLLPLTGALPVK